MSRKSSQRRIEANRRNAAKSTGPKTEEGKAKSAANATTHGLSSLTGKPIGPTCFLLVEDQNAFQGLLDAYIATYQPQHQDELDLLGEAVYAKWRQQRVWAAETGQIEIAIAQNELELQRSLPTANAQAHLANGFAHSEAMVRLYLRYDAQLHRHYKSCLKQLQDLQASRRSGPDSPIEPIQPPHIPSLPEETAPAAPAPNEAQNQAPNEATEPVQTANATLPNEAKPVPQTDAQLFEEYRDRLLQRAAEKLAAQNKISENKPGDLVGNN